MNRLFVALDLPDSVQRLLDQLNPHLPGIRWTLSSQMHLTLGFFGDVAGDAEDVLRTRLSAIEFGSFLLPLRELGAFPGKGSPKIVWIGVGTGHPHLFQLHKRVQEAALAAGIEPDLRPWHPHVTLARCVKVGPATLKNFFLKNTEFDAGWVPVEAFHLYGSQLTPAGPVHTRLMSVPAASGKDR